MVANLGLRSKLLVTVVAGAATLSVACGGTTPSTASASAPPGPAASPSPTPVTTTVTVSAVTNDKLGRILTDGNKTVYVFMGDTGKDSTCYTVCIQFWPPVLTAGPPHAGAGAMASLLGTTARTDGTTQVTYADHPLYYFYVDSAGDANGQGIDGFGGLWWVVSPAGKAITTK